MTTFMKFIEIFKLLDDNTLNWNNLFLVNSVFHRNVMDVDEIYIIY